jgi:hypothetical protein
MGQFKPMVKMETTEPSVELKLKGGGHVKKMQMGGTPADAPSMPPMPARKGAMPARGGAMPAMAPKKPSMAARRRAMMARPSGAAPAGPVGMAGRMMKDGGEALEKHASMPASKAHKGLKTGGVAMGQGGFKSGGSVQTTKMDTAKPDHSPAKTGDVKMGNAGGFKKGGMAKYANGGMVHPRHLDSVTGKPYDPYYLNPQQEPSGNIRLRNPDMMDIMPDPRLQRGSPAGSGDIRSTYAKGGKVKKYAKGGGVEGNVSTSHAGVTGTKTGEVKKANAGGYKEGGSAKKAFATGGLVDTGRPVAMPQGKKRPPSPVSINRLSGTYKKGGEVKMNGGGSASKDKIPDEAALELQVQRNQRAYEGHEKSRAEEAKADRDMLPNLFRRAAKSVKGLFSPPPAASAPGAVTKTEKSAAPAKKRGGAVTC